MVPLPLPHHNKQAVVTGHHNRHHPKLALLQALMDLPQLAQLLLRLIITMDHHHHHLSPQTHLQDLMDHLPLNHLLPIPTDHPNHQLRVQSHHLMGDQM